MDRERMTAEDMVKMIGLIKISMWAKISELHFLSDEIGMLAAVCTLDKEDVAKRAMGDPMNDCHMTLSNDVLPPLLEACSDLNRAILDARNSNLV